MQIHKHSILDEIPQQLSALSRAVELTKQAAIIGFDWPNIQPVFAKMQEELQELSQAIDSACPEAIIDELGDVLFVCANLARHLKIDPEIAIRHANSKFETRFRAVEKAAKKQQPTLSKFALERLEKLWIEVKKQQS